ncbi:ATP/GTP-binding protein [Cellulomonas fimi]|uniref:ATP/GTP-binding protein n=1 Tax=Cellulomonas fimi TaxID=1708 RepID=A0A7Y0QGU5_CELFI|nr:ATP/GTP-binding protein [Cellulomonas fimi]NMR19229.1 ATP/GTP-binding protein [Cellulomonas fimi]
MWLAAPPEGFGATETTPGELAARAVDQMQLTGPAIGHTPDPGRTGLVGVPVWLWTGVGPTTWGPNTATASVPGLSVTATAQASEIAWDMGDGTTVRCANPGTPYFEGGVESPTCQHVYQQSSAGQPDDAYRITATTTWQVTWAGGGASGSLTVTRASSATVRIGEMQVLITG